MVGNNAPRVDGSPPQTTGLTPAQTRKQVASAAGSKTTERCRLLAKVGQAILMGTIPTEVANAFNRNEENIVGHTRNAIRGGTLQDDGTFDLPLFGESEDG